MQQKNYYKYKKCDLYEIFGLCVLIFYIKTIFNIFFSDLCIFNININIIMVMTLVLAR